MISANFFYYSGPPAVCAEEDWTEFYNIDNPTGADLCDCEDIASIRVLHPGLCPNPTAMDVRLANGAHISTVNQVIHKSLSDGFQCYNFEQADGETCADYQVRYCCSISGNFISISENDIYFLVHNVM